MYRRLSIVMFPLLALVLTGALVWGYQENQEKNSILIKAENQYQRAFHDLSYHIDQLHTELGNAMAVNAQSHTFHRKCLLNVWRITSQAQSEINQLPLSLMPFHETSKFLANIAQFSYQTAVQESGQNPLSEDQMETMRSLYAHSQEISQELRKVQTQVIDENLRWMDVELALAQEEAEMDNQIIDGFKTVDKKVGGYSEMNWGPTMNAATREQTFTQLSGNLVTPESIKQKAIEFIGVEAPGRYTVHENGKDTKMHTYSVTFQDYEGNPLNIDYTAKGGHMIWFMNPREVKQTALNLHQAQAKAKQFVEKENFGEVAVVNQDVFDGTAVMTLAEQVNGVIVYPKKLIVNVALDNGEILGLRAVDFVFENKERDVQKPTLTLEQAKQSLNSNFDIMDHTYALIKNDAQQEVICHQFTGKINEGIYRIFINGETGLEEKIDRLNTIQAEMEQAQ